MKHLIFADESSTDKLRYMFIGGIWVDEPTYLQVLEECKNFKKDNNWDEQTKFNWKNVSKKTLPQYCKFIDIFFKYNLQFNCIIIDRTEIELKANALYINGTYVSLSTTCISLISKSAEYTLPAVAKDSE